MLFLLLRSLVYFSGAFLILVILLGQYLIPVILIYLLFLLEISLINKVIGTLFIFFAQFLMMNINAYAWRTIDKYSNNIKVLIYNYKIKSKTR